MKSEKILIIDDEQDIRDLLSYNLAKEGYEVNVASSAKEALKLFPKNAQPFNNSTLFDKLSMIGRIHEAKIAS